MRKIFYIILWVIVLPVSLFVLFLLYSTLFEYKPNEKLTVFSSEAAAPLSDSRVYSAMIWNIGFSGLGSNMDFFYDGGEQVRDTRENVENNLNSISDFIQRNDSIDFILLQEVDFNSKRSFHRDQLEVFKDLLPDHMSFVGSNYKVDFVPVPPKAPMGKVNSGIVTFSRFLPSSSERHSYKGNYSWPTSTFMLKRCFLVNRHKLLNGKEFILINLHNSAYDDGSLRAAQLKQLASFVKNEYILGNFILIAGDWNQSPTGFQPRFEHVFDTIDVSYLPEEFLPGWKQVYSDTIPTNRRIATPYNRKESLTTVIDYYIASPNVEIRSIKTLDLDFINTDHNPVLVTFSLD